MAKTIHLSTGSIGPGATPFLIAEIGANFGDYRQAAKMIDLAHDAGANAVKFQTYRAERITTPGALFTLEDGSTISQYDYFKRYELSEALHLELKRYCDGKDILFFSTPSHQDDVDLLDRLGVELYKTGSDDLTNIPLLQYIARKGKPLMLSSGMSTLATVEEALRAIYATGNQQVVVMHCVVGYPADEREANINVLKTLQHAFDVHLGFSDHFRSPLPAILAATLGATVFEKHLTLDRNAGGPDNDVALTPEEFAEYVRQVRSVPAVLGKSQKTITAGEEKWHAAARKSLTTARAVRTGEPFSQDNITILRPAGGIPPRFLDRVMGKKACRDLPSHETLHWEDIA